MPFLRFAFNTSLSPQQIASRLALITGMEPSWWSLRNDSAATFFGKISDHSFKLRRNIKYRNSFLPMIYGIVSHDMVDTRVEVNMYVHPFVALFLMIWFGGLGLGMVKLIARDGLMLNRPSAILVGMGIFAIALVFGCFFPEANIAKRIIKTTLKAK